MRAWEIAMQLRQFRGSKLTILPMMNLRRTLTVSSFRIKINQREIKIDNSMWSITIGLRHSKGTKGQCQAVAALASLQTCPQFKEEQALCKARIEIQTYLVKDLQHRGAPISEEDMQMLLYPGFKVSLLAELATLSEDKGLLPTRHREPTIRAVPRELLKIHSNKINRSTKVKPILIIISNIESFGIINSNNFI